MIRKPIAIEVDMSERERSVAHLIQEASRYTSRILLETDDKQINAKSIMGVMSLSLCKGEELLVVAEGADEEEAATSIEKFLKNIK